MNRKEALKFIRDHSRLVRQHHTNPVPKHERDADYEPNYTEQRISDKGIPFIVNDYGKHGWELYFISGTNNTDEAIAKFKTNCLKENNSAVS